MGKNPSGKNLVWMDLEMTGLNPEQDEIIEIATLITDPELNIVAEGPDLVLHQPRERFERMDEWNQKQHTKSGLWQQVVESPIDARAASAQTLAFLQEHVEAGSSPLCGNSIWQDRRFLSRYMPDVDRHLHYRIIDVSTIKELAWRWFPDARPYKKALESHRALDDIKESIEELRYYRKSLFHSPTQD